jgi:hypothetical protein
MAKQTVYFGRFISTPAPAELLIRSGAVLVAGDDGSGFIADVDWEVQSAAEAKQKFGPEAELVTGDEDGFFFPGFIGTLHILWDGRYGPESTPAPGQRGETRYDDSRLIFSRKTRTYTHRNTPTPASLAKAHS